MNQVTQEDLNTYTNTMAAEGFDLAELNPVEQRIQQGLPPFDEEPEDIAGYAPVEF